MSDLNGHLDSAAATLIDRTDPLTDATYVRLCAGLAVLADDKGLIVEGGMRRWMLAGDSATQVVPTLVPLLDGSRTFEEISVAAGMSRTQLRQAVSLLRLCDLVEYDEVPRTEPPGVAPYAASFLGRTVHATELYRNSRELHEALASCAVLVLAAPQVGAAIATDLRECGIDVVQISGTGGTAAIESAVDRLAGARRPLIVAVDDGAARLDLAVVDGLCRTRDLPWLRTARQGQRTEVGPLFLRGHTGCYECFSRSHREVFGERPADATDEAVHADILDEALAALVTGESLALLGQIRAAHTFHTVVVRPSGVGDERRLIFTPYPDCPRCANVFPSPDAADSIACYDWYVEGAPAVLPAAGLGRMALHRPPLRDLGAKRSVFPSSPSVPLPPAPTRETLSSTLTRPGGATVLDMDTLATILPLVGGRQDVGDPTAMRRWAPNGGNLASVRLYAVGAGTGFEPISGTVTVYDDIAHRLIAVHARQVTVEQMLDGTGVPAVAPSIALAFVADAGRFAEKYGNFTYRLCHLDAGVATAQLAAVARDHGLDVTFAPTWSPALGELLDLQPDREFVTALALITPGGILDAARD
jgi:hypothetical protein